MKNYISLFLIFFLFSPLSLLSVPLDETPTSLEQEVITAGLYTLFLNDVAQSDTDNLYNEILKNEFSLIIRSGTPGSYSYFITEENKDCSLFGVSQHSLMHFCNWLDERNQISNNSIYDLEEDQLFQINGNAPFFLINKNGNEVIDLSLISNLQSPFFLQKNFSLETQYIYKTSFSPEEDPLKHPIERKTLKAFVAYCISTGSFILGCQMGETLASFLGYTSLTPTLICVMLGSLVGCIAAIVLVDYEWCLINDWLNH